MNVCDLGSTRESVIVIELLYLRMLQAAESTVKNGGPNALVDKAFIEGLQRGYLETRVISDMEHASHMRRTRGHDLYKAGLLCGQSLAAARDSPATWKKQDALAPLNQVDSTQW